VAPAAPAAVDDKAAGPAGQRFDELVVPAPSASSKNSRAAPQKGTGVRGPRSALRSPSRDGLVVARIPSSI
jgi:hypothetical protein